MGPKAHTPLARFMAGAFALVAPAAAGQAMVAASMGLAISTPLGAAILGSLAAFAGGAAVYKGRKQAESDARIAEIHEWLEQLIKQHGDLAKAMAALPWDLPFSHADSCERIRRIAAVFAPGPEGIQARLEADAELANFAGHAIQTIEATLAAHQADLDRLIQMAFNAKAINEDQLAAIDRVVGGLEALHDKADAGLSNQGQILAMQEEHTKMLAEVKSLLEKMQAQRPSPDQPDESLNRDLASAVQRLADDAARGVHTAERVLEVNDPNAVPTYLKARRTRLAEAQAALNDRITAEAIQIDRELAATAFVTGQIDVAIEALQRILSFAPNDLDAINQLGQIYELRGELPASEQQYKRLLELDPSDSTRAVALGNLGLLEKTRGNLDAAEDYHKQALVINKALGCKAGMASQLGNLGLIEQMRGNLDAAVDYHEQSLAINKALTCKEGMANQLGNLGLIERIRGNLDAAEGYHKQSLAISVTLGRKEGMAIQLGNLGGIEMTRGYLDSAEDYHKRSLTIEQAIGRKEGMANQLGNLGVIEVMRGNLDAAEHYYKQALAINMALERKEGMANQLGNLGVIDMMRENLDAAEDYHKQSLAINKVLECKEGMANQLGNLGLIERKRGNLDAAEDYHKQSLAISVTLGRKESIANQLGNLGLIERTRGNLAAARDHWTRSRDIFAQVGMPHMVARIQKLIDALPLASV